MLRSLFVLAVLFASLPAFSQPGTGGSKSKKPSRKSAASVEIAHPAPFAPTCNLDSGSVGFYFFPANLGAKWTMRTVSQVLNAESQVEKSDTVYSYEKVVSDSDRSLDGLPILTCISSYPYQPGGEYSAKTKRSEYYVDDSIVIAVMNHSVGNGLSHIFLVNPLKTGASWRDDQDDTIRSKIIAMDEPVTTILGTFPHALVVQSRLGFGDLSKYFVKGMGIVKTVFRGIAPRENGAFVVTNELMALDRGDPKRSIKFRFVAPEQRPLATKPAKPKTQKKK